MTTTAIFLTLGASYLLIATFTWALCIAAARGDRHR